MDFPKSEIDLLRQQHPDPADRISADMTSSDFLKSLTDVATQRDTARDRAGQRKEPRVSWGLTLNSRSYISTRKHPRRDASGWAWCSDESAFYMGFSMPLLASALSLNESIDL